MTIHGTEHQVEKRITYLRSEQMAQAERLYEMEGRLKQVLARLDAVERELAGRGVSVDGDH